MAHLDTLNREYTFGLSFPDPAIRIEGMMSMAHDPSQYQRCQLLLAALNDEEGWKLDSAAQQQYIVALIGLIDVDTYGDDSLQRIMVRYHQDHKIVQALQNRDHPLYDVSWAEWLPQVLRILRRNSLFWTDDVAVDEEDLAQIAWSELARSLPSFKYNSRLSTWAHQVITQSVQRVLRDSHAKKRAGRPGSLDQDPDLNVSIDERDHPETQADMSALYTLACDVLSKHKDQRLVHIFKLWQQEDASVVELGEELNLSTKRIRSLIMLIRELLRTDPAFRSWLNDDGPPIVGAA